MKHPHAESMAEYIKDWKETSEPWLRWQHKIVGLKWVTCNKHPFWTPGVKYRRKPEPVKTININGFEVPEPCRGPLSAGIYWISDLRYGPLGVNIDQNNAVRNTVEKGLIFSTKAAAELHIKALLSFTAEGE